MKNLKTFLPVIIFLVVIIVVGVVVFFISDGKTSSLASGNQNGQSATDQSSKENSDPIENIDQKWSKGNSKAKVQITEFSDFQCPYCQKGADTIATVFEKYKDQINVTFSNFPLTSIHPFALRAAEAAEAAGYQGKFWEMHDLLFANQKNLTDSDLESYAKKLGLDMTKFDSYFNNKNIESKITKQEADATVTEYDELALDASKKVIVKGKAKIEGTPAFLINGKLIVGAYPPEDFEIFIKYFLAQK
ncbi:MAG: thioredoxin domain-containing protein [Patescibacteria group bacterium]|nr:thioredoxin domain-containing protein [Patescibacteria group bacterium]